jgi:polyisoprenoid-binding protein YceI
MQSNKPSRRYGALALLAMFALVSVAFAATPWKTQPAQSTLSFVGTQAGAEFSATFRRFTATIQFDAEDLDGSSFDVSIDLKSIDSKDAERDDIIRGPDIFATERWPTAHYVGDRFTSLGRGKYRGEGNLTLRDVTREVPIEFTYEANASGGWLVGSATLDRLDFGVGQGEWRDTQWVGNGVRVEFALRLQH